MTTLYVGSYLAHTSLSLSTNHIVELLNLDQVTTTMAAVPAVPLAPALAAKPVVAAASSPSPSTPVATPGSGSITSKEWVIPPRPKPGRKPATDTPPTKRKAQNRAAQRAFRERRAARVNELEDQIKEIEDEHEMQLTAFKDQIRNLSQEMEQCRNEMSRWRDRCQSLEKEVSIERGAKEALAKELRSSFSGPDSVNHPRLRGSSRSGPSDAGVNEAGQDRHRDNSGNEQGNFPLGCGNCLSTHCQCIEDAFRMPGIEEQGKSHSKSVGSPNPGTRRQVQSEPEIKPEPEEMEIDFTSRFAGIQPQPNSSNDVSSPPVDPCGFCQDGTPCICAEMAAQEEQRPRRDSFDNNRLAPIQSLSQFTPPPSEGDVRSEVTLPPISEATNPCANGPGTCSQCLSDPRSTLFCKSLAASRSASAAPSGCCGGKGPEGGCCQSRNPNPPQRSAPNPATTSSNADSLTLSCADTFTTLSRHPNFSRASDEISTWLPKLHTLPNPRDLRPVEQSDSRAALEVEAASVMGVLRYFDRRFAHK